MLPIAAEIAVRMTRQQARSALPDAPVVPDETTRRRSRASAWTSPRLRAAGLLRLLAASAARVADRIDQQVRAA